MTTQVLLFGQLRELVGKDSLSIDIATETLTVEALRRHLVIAHQDAPFGDALTQHLQTGKTFVAINQSIAQEHDTLSANDEIAIFPPVTGG